MPDYLNLETLLKVPYVEPDPVVTRARQRVILEGDPPSPINPPSGCRFHTRCPIAKDYCSEDVPEWREVKKGHWVACHEVKF